ncbi:MAG: LacI family DNA-binding transcriptional regulator [Acholeplasmataceae bacterium]|nr:LacI family transcriptional regulator [Acholeplasmataceae bacterium]MCK9234214.1 LacI family transcriptional regulator [Acholeplasmataceae bacterium]MCK9289572.1 LacI family transcriptional regulator [Acholeplasmataceae bacterium]MCK9428015.1 LacI family transcriptional regulator [Acholeplasmataceae bacterium]MDD4090220.1 LacI family DNA-binding transcriptional regulator [Acholeplasmataceae bacterium]
MKKMKTKTTIYDISRELKLAPSTISKVINGKGKVSDFTRKRVLDYIDEIGYVPNNSARMLKSGRSYTIGVIFSEELSIGLEHPFFSSILQHFKTYVENLGYELSFIVSKLGKHKLSYYEWCVNKKVDGVYIVVGDYKDKGMIELTKKNIPIVSTDIIFDGIKTVISNNEEGIFLAMEHFIKSTKEIGIITGPLHSKAFKERYDAYVNFLHKNNININKNYIIESESFGFTSGYNACLNLLKQANPLPKALVVGSDEIAVGVLKCLNDNKIEIPNEIEVIGFDDNIYSRYVTPSLSTIAQNKVEIGSLAGKYLLDMIENKTKLDSVTRVGVKLIHRESTKKY